MSISEVIESLRNDIIQTLKKENIPGLAISIVNKEGTIWSECFGYTYVKKTRKVDTDAIFSIQSMGKTITATAFLLAVQGGLINLDDKLLDYYHEFCVNSRFEENEEKKNKESRQFFKHEYLAGEVEIRAIIRALRDVQGRFCDKLVTSKVENTMKNEVFRAIILLSNAAENLKDAAGTIKD